MKSLLRTTQFVAQFITLGLAFAFVVSLFSPQSVERLRSALRPTEATPRSPVPETPATPAGSQAGASLASFGAAVSRAAPAVVSIYANKVETSQQVLVPRDPQLRNTVAPIPVGPPISVSTRSLGSGVIVDADGYVLTNYHVIKNAQDIYAVLQDGRVVAAKVIGSDEESDLAVLHIDGINMPTLLPAEQTPAVGDVVLAIGSPFGLGNTVTMGIVSALRQWNPASGEDFIQTDAAINAGNSGGALVNTAGQLVGINSNNYSVGGGGSVGIGFAIPVATARRVLNDIRKHGRVIRAWLGAAYLDVPPRVGDPIPIVSNGVYLTAVYPNSPAARAGLQPGDVITHIDGALLPNQAALRSREAQLAPGDKIKLGVERDMRQATIEVTLEEKPAPANPVTTGSP